MAAGQWRCRRSARLYRLLDKLSAGKHTTGSARTRRSLADRPDGPFGAGGPRGRRAR